MDKLLEGAEFFSKAAYGIDELSLADLFYYPSVERFYIANGIFFEDVTVNEPLINLKIWFDKMKTYDWVKAVT